MRYMILMMVVGLAPSIHAAAEDSATLAPVIVTASRSPQATDDVVLPIIVISGEEIQRRQVTDLAELLATVPGIDIGRNGGPGQATSLFVRGTESNHVLVLVDGLRINPSTIGGPNLQHIDPAMVERIEILRGPRAAIYGDQAMGGVINIITRADVGSPGVSASLRVGSDSTAGVDAHIGARHAAWSFDLAAGTEYTDGYAFRRGSAVTPDYRNTSMDLGVSHRGDGASTSIRVWEARTDLVYLDFFLAPLSQTSDNRTLQLERTDRIGADWSSNLRFSQSLDDIRQDQSSDFVRSDRLAIDWLNRIDLGDDLMLGIGINLEQERASAFSFGSGFDQRSDHRAIYGDLIGGSGPDDWMLALRYSDYERAGGQLTWNAEYSHRRLSGIRMYASAGTAFRAPDAFDRYGFGGDPDLDPERSTSLELGLEHDFAPGRELRLSLYHTEIRDLIEFDLGSFTLMNTERARIVGLELAYALRSGPWEMQAAAVLQRPDNLSTGTDLARRAGRSLDLALSRELGLWHLRADLQLVGARLDSPFAATRIGGYALLDLAVSRQLSDEFVLRLRVENLGDAAYQTADGYLGRGRSLFLTLGYQRGRD